MSHAIYDEAFYRRQQEGSRRSARVVVPTILDLVGPRSAVDVGCGVGTWLSVLLERGVADVLGIDGSYVDRHLLAIPADRFRPADLTRPLPAERGFDLALSLEVAEHLPPERAAGFIDDLTRLAPVVVFSAAIPHQMGDGHINEQWPSFWYRHFRRNGFRAFDVLRDPIWNHPEVEPWYAQNLLLYVREDTVSRLPKLDGARAVDDPATLDRVHPVLYRNTLRVLSLTLEQARAPADPRQERRNIVKALMALDEAGLAGLASSPVFARFRALIDSGLPDEPLDAAAEQELAAVPERPDSLTAALAGYLARLLYKRPFRLGRVVNLRGLPPMLAVPLLRILLKPPALFQEPGDPDSLADYLERLTEHVHSIAATEPGNPLAQVFAQEANFVPAYFNNRNLKDLYTRRAQILEGVLRARGAALEWTPPRPPATPAERRLRLGVLAADFVGRTETFTTLPVFKGLDRSRFAITLFALRPAEDAVTAACRGHADDYILLPEALDAAVSAIRAHALDVLVVGTNVTAVWNRVLLLAAHRLARVQVTSVSSPVTTGLTHMDVYISGALSEAPQSAAHYSERLLTVDRSGHCFDYSADPQPPVPPPTRASLGLAEDAVVFASGANMLKIGPDLRDTWAEILAGVPRSVLLLCPFGPAWQAGYPERLFVQAMERALAARGVEPGRVRCSRGLPGRQAVKALLSVVDVYLDSFPYAGANSTVDPLELGIPIIALRGTTFRSQQGAAILLDLGLPGMVADDRSAYVSLAKRLGNDAGLRRSAAEAVVARMAARPRFLDTTEYARQIEALLLSL